MGMQFGKKFKHKDMDRVMKVTYCYRDTVYDVEIYDLENRYLGHGTLTAEELQERISTQWKEIEDV